MTVPDVDIPQLLNTLAGIHERAPWAHSLAYDRPGRNLDPDHTWTTGTGGDTDRPPVGRWDDDGNITAIADTEAGHRWHELVRLLRGAHHDLHVVLLRHRNPRHLDPTYNPLATNERGDDRPRNHVTARHIQQACESLTRLLRPLMSADLPAALTSELSNVAAAINTADQLFPAIEHHPPQPLLCRDPRRNRDAEGNSQCWGVVAHHARQLCESCLKLEDMYAAEHARHRAEAQDPACRCGCGARRAKGRKGLAAGCYMREYRANQLAQEQLA